jgi:aspartyl-tRNA(Asn)/glutamyl-tRNA(Gln) amidotransferase subunit A
MRDTISALSNLLHTGKISSVELTKQYIEEIKKQNPVLNAYVHPEFDFALKSAERADKMLKEGNASPLCGIPMTLKDNISTKGMETTCCSRILQGYKPFYDATVWEKLYAQGAVLLGKTNMDEFAMGSTCETSCYGGALNPRDLTRVPGGSSGGGASAVCANLAAYALGSDTGGSIRQPASFCGVVGLKPTYGAVSRCGLIAYGSSLDQIGPITTGVKDAAIVFDAIKGLDKRDGTSVNCDMTSIADRLGKEIKGLKIGVVEEYFDGIDEGIRQSVEDALRFFESRGAQIVRFSLPALKLALPVYYIIACAEASSNLGRYDGIRFGYQAEKYTSVEDMIVSVRSEAFGKEVKRRIMLGSYVLSSGYYDAYYKKARLLRGKISADFEEAFRTKCDLILAPTAPNTAFPLHYSNENRIEMYLSDICTVPVNIAGVPSVSIPCGTDKNGLPVGMQFIGKKFDEFTILNAAYDYANNGGKGVPDQQGGVLL